MINNSIKEKKIEKFEFTDRYKATGIPYPDENSCDECEGMGLYPTRKEKLNETRRPSNQFRIDPT